jgi:hypothetical protein
MAVTLVVDRETRFLQNREVTPHCSDGAAKLARRVLDRQALRAAEKLNETPLARKLVPSGHRVRGFCVSPQSLSIAVRRFATL